MQEPKSTPEGGDVVARATGAQAEELWRANLESLFDAVMAVPVGRLLSPRATADAVEGAFSREVIDDGVRPAAKLLWILVLGQLRDDKRRIGEYVSDDGREALLELVTRPDVVPERLIHEILEDEAAREVVSDLIYEALREFQDKVNPFTADWGLPALLKRLGPFGLAGVSKAFDSVRGEFEKRLEPEMRRFLTTFTGRGVKRVAAYVVDHSGDRSFIALRKRLVGWVLDQSVQSAVSSMGEPLLDRGHDVGSELAGHAVTLDSVRSRRRLVVEQLVMLHADQPLGEALAQYGIVARPDFDLAARVTWPFVRAALSSEAGARWLRSLAPGSTASAPEAS
ncbi:MAG: hypothetical protein R3B70_45470 [Polyangiaceae bacterium]